MTHFITEDQMAVLRTNGATMARADSGLDPLPVVKLLSK